MKLPTQRLNIRRMAIALVVVALIVVLEVGRRRRVVYQEKAAEYAIAEQSSLLAIQLSRNPSRRGSPTPRRSI